MADLQDKLGELGQYVVGMTPVLRQIEGFAGTAWSKGHRQVEIQMWLDEHANKDSDWIAIDDIAHWFFDGCTRVFITDSYRGLDKRYTALFRRFAFEAFGVSTRILSKA